MCFLKLLHFLRLQYSLLAGLSAHASPSQTTFHAGTVVDVTFVTQGTKPTYRVTADFGSDIGLRVTSLQTTHAEDPRSLIGKKIAGVTEIGRPGTMTRSTFFLVADRNQDGSMSVQRLHPDTPNGVRIFVEKD